MKRAAFLFAVIFSIFLLSSISHAQSTSGTQPTGKGINWVDANGDGICDNFGTANQVSLRAGKGYGKKDGTGNPVRPQDGTGFGQKGGKSTVSGTGVCDGTGPKGSVNRGGRK